MAEKSKCQKSNGEKSKNVAEDELLKNIIALIIGVLVFGHSISRLFDFATHLIFGLSNSAI
jgi:hypothetical protein